MSDDDPLYDGFRYAAKFADHALVEFCTTGEWCVTVRMQPTDLPEPIEETAVAWNLSDAVWEAVQMCEEKAQERREHYA